MSKYRSGKRYADILTILLVIIIIAIVALLGYFGYKAIDKKSVETNASNAADEFENNLENNKEPEEELPEEPEVPEEPSTGNTDLSNLINTDNNQKPQDNTTNNNNNNNNNNSNKTYLDGYEIKGIIKISKTGIRYPILERVTVDSLTKSVAILDIAACPEITTAVKELNVPGTNALILGHNYRNGMFFSDNDKLTNGDKITITDSSGQTVTYTIYDMYYTTANDIDFMKRELDPNVREITLQTCNEDSSQRLIIQARDINK